MFVQQIDGTQVVTQSRWRSPVLWSALVGQVIALIIMTGLDKEFGIDTGRIGDIAAWVIQFLVMVGILNNPSSSNTW